MTEKPKIGIVIGTTRPARFGDKPARWFHDIAQRRADAEFEIVDLRDFPMPFFEEDRSPNAVKPKNEVALRWAEKVECLDGFVFVTAEYNHSIPAVLKNALDYAYPEYRRKPAAFIGYGSNGATRAVEHLRGILAELHIASLKHTVHINRAEMLGMLREGKSFADYPYLEETTQPLLDDIVWWAGALKSARNLTRTADSILQ